MDKTEIIKYISPPIELQLAKMLIDEYISLEKRYILGDWEPAILDGGQFCEISARIIYHIDSNTLSLRKGVSDCLNYIEDDKNKHHYPERKSALHLCKVIRTIYKFRSDRGAVHIDPVYTANQIDSKLVIENSKWILSEFLRVFWTSDKNKIVIIIKNLISFDTPIIGDFDGLLMVQRTDFNTDEEILTLLHYAGNLGLSRKEMGQFVKRNASTISNAIKKLSSSNSKKIIKITNNNYRLTDLGEKFILEKFNNLSLG